MTVLDAEVQENVYSKLVVMVLNKRKGAKEKGCEGAEGFGSFRL
jgi:hypothetical protein